MKLENDTHCFSHDNLHISVYIAVQFPLKEILNNVPSSGIFSRIFWSDLRVKHVVVVFYDQAITYIVQLDFYASFTFEM